MVGGRRQALETATSYTNGKDSRKKSLNEYERLDLEASYGSINPMKPRQRFRDAIQTTIQSNRTAELKKKLIDNVDHEILEKFRKSDESVRELMETMIMQTTNGSMTAQNHQE